MKPLLVGVAPVPGTPGTERGIAFVETNSGANLARLMGLEDSYALQEHFDMVNLWRTPDPAWNKRDATRRARAMERALILPRRYDRVVLFSSPVAQAFGFPYLPLLTWREREYGTDEGEHCVEFAVCAHPSGLTRWWNDPLNREAARRFFQEVMACAKS